jgi:hypothetical protein
MPAPWPLEPGPEELEAQTRMVAAFVLAQLGGLAEAPSFDLDGAESVRTSFVEDPPEQPTALGPLLERLKPAIAKSYNTAGPDTSPTFRAEASMPRRSPTSWPAPSTATWVSRRRRPPSPRSRRPRSRGCAG